MRIAIVDDEIRMYERLKDYFQELLGASAALTYFQDGEHFLQQWQPGAFDLIILDIFMNRFSGIDVAREIRRTDPEVRLVFGTTSNEFASESYEVNASYYLLKPFGKEQVQAMLNRLDLAQLEKLRTIRLPDGTSVVLRDIIYADYASHCTTLHCVSGKTHSLRTNFSEIEGLLCTYPCFFSPTKGIVINFHEVASQNADTFTMSDHSRIPVSRRRAKETLDAYSSFLFEQLRKGGAS